MSRACSILDKISLIKAENNLKTYLWITITYLLINLQKENRKLLKLHNQLEYNIQHDSLTQLLNRHSFENNINQFDQPAILLISPPWINHSVLIYKEMLVSFGC